jgi:hypothetical protein
VSLGLGLIPEHAFWLSSDVYVKIMKRLLMLYNIQIHHHIKRMISIHESTGDGITFVPHDHTMLIAALTATGKFEMDDRRHLAGAAASAATNGVGYREQNYTSLHCQIAPDECNIHIDRVGFVAIGPDGKAYYSPDLVQHILDELLMAKLVAAVRDKNRFIGNLLGRVHPVVPTEKTRYHPAIGAKVVIGRGEDVSLRKSWEISFDFSHTCNDTRCSGTSNTAVLKLTIAR